MEHPKDFVTQVFRCDKIGWVRDVSCPLLDLQADDEAGRPQQSLYGCSVLFGVEGSRLALTKFAQTFHRLKVFLVPFATRLNALSIQESEKYILSRACQPSH